MPTLFVLGGPEIGRSFEIGGGALLGRSPECEVPLAAPSVSRNHARLVLEGETWVVLDLGSRNGLFSGDRRVERLELRDGDIFRVGDVELRFRLTGTAQDAPRSAGPRPTPAPAPSPPPAPPLPPRAAAPGPSAFDVDEIVLDPGPEGDGPHATQTRPMAAPPGARTIQAPSAAAPRSAPPRGGGAVRPGLSAGPDVRTRDSRPPLEFSRVEDRGGFLTGDLSQYPLWLRLAALLAALALFVGVFLFAFRGTALLKGKLGGGAPSGPFEESR